jgi:hypothetical protein
VDWKWQKLSDDVLMQPTESQLFEDFRQKGKVGDDVGWFKRIEARLL